MRRLTFLLSAALCLLLTGCSAAAFFLSGCGSPEADLVVINNSRREVWSISLDYGDQTQAVGSTGDRALLAKGQSCGLLLEEETGEVTVVLSGRADRELARRTVAFTGERLYLTLEEDRTLTVSEEWYSG